MLEGSQLTIRKGGKVLLDKVSVRAEPGRITVIIGPNGAGKTTLIRTLSGDEKPAGGEVLFHGKPLGDWPPRVLSRQVAFLAQNSALDFPFTVREVVLMGRLNHYRFLESREDLQAADAALRRVDLEHVAHRDFTTLSGGEKQRVNLARALCQLTATGSAEGEGEDLPKFLILDEPNNNLDIRHQLGVLEIARQLCAEGVGILAILHDLAQARALADHLVVMDAGRVAAAGPPEVLDAPLIFQVFGVQLHQHPEALNLPYAFSADR